MFTSFLLLFPYEATDIHHVFVTHLGRAIDSHRKCLFHRDDVDRDLSDVRMSFRFTESVGFTRYLFFLPFRLYFYLAHDFPFSLA